MRPMAGVNSDAVGQVCDDVGLHQLAEEFLLLGDVVSPRLRESGQTAKLDEEDGVLNPKNWSFSSGSGPKTPPESQLKLIIIYADYIATGMHRGCLINIHTNPQRLWIFKSFLFIFSNFHV